MFSFSLWLLGSSVIMELIPPGVQGLVSRRVGAGRLVMPSVRAHSYLGGTSGTAGLPAPRTRVPGLGPSPDLCPVARRGRGAAECAADAEGAGSAPLPPPARCRRPFPGAPPAKVTPDGSRGVPGAVLRGVRQRPTGAPRRGISGRTEGSRHCLERGARDSRGGTPRRPGTCSHGLSASPGSLGPRTRLLPPRSETRIRAGARRGSARPRGAAWGRALSRGVPR